MEAGDFIFDELPALPRVCGPRWERDLGPTPKDNVCCRISDEGQLNVKSTRLSLALAFSFSSGAPALGAAIERRSALI